MNNMVGRNQTEIVPESYLGEVPDIPPRTLPDSLVMMLGQAHIISADEYEPAAEINIANPDTNEVDTLTLTQDNHRFVRSKKAGEYFLHFYTELGGSKLLKRAGILVTGAMIIGAAGSIYSKKKQEH